MSPPSLKTQIIGFPPVTLLVIGASGYVGWRAYVELIMGQWLVMMLCGWIAWQALKSFDQRRRHRAWRRDCMAIAGQSPSRASHRRGHPLIGLAVLLAVWGGIIAISDQRELPIEIGLVVIGGLTALWFATLLARGLRRLLQRRPRAEKSRPVTIAIHRPAMAVPPMSSAYRALPPYAKTLLKGRS